MFCQLGNIIFEGLKSPTSLSSKEGAVFAEHALINTKARLQPTGHQLKEITIALKLHQSFCSIETELQNLRDAVAGFKVMPLLWGNGKLEGNFVATELGVETEETDNNGNRICIILSVSLKEFYIKDQVNIKQQEARKNAFATGNKTPPVKTNRVNPSTCEQTVSNIISASKSRAASINKICFVYQNAGRENNDIKTHLSYINNHCERLLTIANTSGSCASTLSGFKEAASNLKSQVGFMSSAEPGNMGNMKTQNDILQNRVRLVERVSAPLIKKAATRHG
jgi:phage protein U